MSDQIYPRPTHETAALRRSLAPEAEAAFQAFSKAVFADGAFAHSTLMLSALQPPAA